MSLTPSQVDEAIEQMKSYCRDAEETNYHAMSARGVLYSLGYHADADQVIQDIAARGFDYCLDPSVESYNGVEDKKFYPSEAGCYWGPDQLRSRLECLRSRRP